MIGLISVLMVAAAPTQLAGPWLTFRRSPAFDRRMTTIEVGTLTSIPDWHYWFRRTVRRGRVSQVWWTDTKRCPDSRWVVIEAGNIPLPRISVPERDDFIIMGDGVGYGIETSAFYPGKAAGDVRFTSNVDTPLAAWVDESLRKLEPCWSKEAP